MDNEVLPTEFRELTLLYKSVDEINHQEYWEYQLDNGDYLIDVNNKIIISDGKFQKPSIEGIVELSKYSSKISEARDLIYENIDRRPIWEIIEDINYMCQEKVASFYRPKNSRYDSENGRQRVYGDKNREINANQGRRRVSQIVRYSLEDGEGVYKYSKNKKQPIFRLFFYSL